MPPDRPAPDRPATCPASDPDDPKGLIRESFRIEGIGDAECRSILIDWALSLETGRDQRAALARLLAGHAAAPGHPMTRLMQDAVASVPSRPARRGGRAGRFGRAE